MGMRRKGGRKDEKSYHNTLGGLHQEGKKGGAYGTMLGNDRYTSVLGNVMEKDHLQDLGVNVIIILRHFLRNTMRECCVYLFPSQ
jgi:hypothetical protein